VKQFSKFVGLDVHKATIAISVADANGGEVRYAGGDREAGSAVEKGGRASFVLL
jgi:transposase